MINSLDPVVSMIPLLDPIELRRIVRLKHNQDGLDCLIYINPIAQMGKPRLSPAINKKAAVKKALLAAQRAVPITRYRTRQERVIRRLPLLLHTLGLFSVDIPSILEGACIGEDERWDNYPSLWKLLSRFAGTRPDSFLIHSMEYLSTALIEKAQQPRIGLPSTDNILLEVYLAFFDRADQVARGDSTGKVVPSSSARPREILRLVHPGHGNWLYYQESVTSSYSPDQGIGFYGLTREESRTVLGQLSEVGAVRVTALGLRLQSLRNHLDRIVVRVSDSCENVRKSSRRLPRHTLLDSA